MNGSIRIGSVRGVALRTHWSVPLLMLLFAYGLGSRTLPAFRLAHGATLRWQTSGGFYGGAFAIRVLNPRADIANPQLAISHARSGSVHLAPGRYVLRIDSAVRWVVTIG